VRAIVAWNGPAVAVLIAAWSTGSLAPQEAALHLADGTRIRVRLLQFISSETSTPGAPVHLDIAEDVAVDGSLAIKRGTLATGTIPEAAPVIIGRRGDFDRTSRASRAPRPRCIAQRRAVARRRFGLLDTTGMPRARHPRTRWETGSCLRTSAGASRSRPTTRRSTRSPLCRRRCQR